MFETHRSSSWTGRRGPTALTPIALALLLGACGAPPDADVVDTESASAGIQMDTGLRSEQFGGNGVPDPRGCSTWFPVCADNSGIQAGSFDLQARGRLKKITIWSGKYVDGMELVWQDPQNPQRLIPSQHVGGTGGGARSFELRDGEAIIGVSGRSGRFVDQITVATNQGRIMTWGQGGGGEFSIPLEPGDEVHGFAGISGLYIDAISVWSYLP